jgi:hypothetical protein
LEKISQKQKSILKWLFKIALSAFALFLVSRKINFQEVWVIFKESSHSYLIPAFILFNLSKIISAVRYRLFIRLAGAVINSLENLKLYYIGMFYNLFLPGGIGGDGYKIYLLSRAPQHDWKELTWATVVERFSGLAALLGLLLMMIPFSSIYPLPVNPVISGLFGLILPFFGLYFVLLLVRKLYCQRYLITSLQSIGVQFSQLVCAWFILLALGIQDNLIEYLVLFLASSVVAVIPFTIGGVGARELLFVYAGQYMLVDLQRAVAFTLLFFMITALSSFVGVFFNFKTEQPSSTRRRPASPTG